MHFVARARHLEAQIDQLMARQISYAHYCRTRATAIRERAEQIKFPEFWTTMLRLALSYERIADSVELCIRRLSDNAKNDASSLLADGGRGSHRSRRLSSSASGKAPLQKQNEEGGRGERGVKLHRS